MKHQYYTVVRYDADEGKVFDWATLPEDGSHLYAKTIFLSFSDKITNYIEVDKPTQEEK